MAAELIKTISRIRRAMPRNADVMTICDELENRICNPPSTLRLSGEFEETKDKLFETAKQADVVVTPPLSKKSIKATVVNVGDGALGFDKKAYQREYMKRTRAKKKAEG